MRSPAKSHDAPANDSAASRSPGTTDSVMPSSASRATNSSALRASREADVATAVTVMPPPSSGSHASRMAW